MVTTVIVVAVLAVVAVAFMQSTTTDRLSSRSVANYTRAQLAAEGGAAAAQAMVADLVKRYPDSATVWQNIGGGAPNGTSNEATVLYVRAQASATNLGASPAQFGGAVTILAQPLVSRVGATPETFNTNPLPLSNVVSSVPFPDNTAVNINATNAARPEPFVGSRSSTNPGSPITAAQWIYLTQNGGPTNATNPYVARYAFWIEDESFKVNVNVATNGSRGTTSLGTNATEVRIDGSWASSTNTQVKSASANFASIAALRGSAVYPQQGAVPSVLTAGLAAGLTDSSAASEVKFLTTIHSAGLDLSRGGFKRFNINTITNGDKREALDRIIAAITNSNSSPLFGQRFYRTGANAAATANTNVSADHAKIYLQKIAANIYDYVDSDDLPTIINNDSGFTLRTGRPQFGIEADGAGGGVDGPNSVAAVGVENVPQLQEYAIHARILSMRHDPADPESFGYSSTNTNAPVPTQATYEIWIDHYFEFWNPGTRDYIATNAFLKIWDQPGWDGASGDLASPAREKNDITVAIPNGTVFPAGGIMVLTTAPLNEASLGGPSGGIVSATNNFIPLNAAAGRKFNGTTSKLLINPSNAYVRYQWPPRFNTEPRPADTNKVPFYDRLFCIELPFKPEAGVLIGNDLGLVTSFRGLTVTPQSAAGTAKFQLAVSNGYVLDALSHRSFVSGNNDNVRGSSLRGNSDATATPSMAEGDPRTLNEQLEFFSTPAGGGAGVNDTRFSVTWRGDSTDPNSPFPGTMTFGLPNTNYVASVTNLTTKWLDASSFRAGAASAPLFVRNGPMLSIGELGHITDPARDRGTNPLIARGGGRTLRVGQPEVGSAGSTPINASVWWYAGNQTNVSRTWPSWRLADFFTTTVSGANPSPLGVWRSTNGFTIPGLINPNGALRDNGAAIKAALFGLAGEPSPDPTNSGTQGASGFSGANANITNFVTNVIGRLTSAAAGVPPGALNAFWERGEISELRLLNNGNALVNGLQMSNVFDRGREELVRRSIEMITPRGSIFSAYVLGQALQVSGATTNVLSTARMKSTFEIIPRATAPATNDSFAPADAAIRFAALTNYSLRVLNSFYD